MKIIIFLFAIILLVSCRKDDQKGLGIVTGKTDDLIVTVYDTTINAEIDGNYGEELYNIDLDNDGVNDLRFFSFENEFPYYEPKMYYKAWVQIINDQVNVIEVADSWKQYEQITIGYDFSGTFPRKTYYHTIKCDSFPDSHIYNQSNLNTAYCFHKDILLGTDLEWNNKYSELNLIREKYTGGNYNFTPLGDSLIGDIFEHEGLCTSAPLDEYFYLVFRIKTGFKAKYGWIELKITDHNSIYISRSAISAAQ